MFLVGIIEERLAASVMAGYDGHAADQLPGCGAGLQDRVMPADHGIRRAPAAGRVPEDQPANSVNEPAGDRVYERLGFRIDDVVSMGSGWCG